MSRRGPEDILRALFVNENIGGHATMHRHLRAELSDRDDITAAFLDVPKASGARRIVGAAVPGLGRFDADLQPLRAQLALSRWVDRRLRQRADRYDVLHAYTHNAVLLSTDQLAARPSVVANDGTNEQNAYTLPYRKPSRWTPAAVRVTRRFEDRVYAAATMVVAQSEWASRSLRDDYGVGADRLRVIPFGIQLPPRTAPIETDEPEITFVGTSLERKGGRRLISVFNDRLRDRAILNLVTPEPVDGDDRIRVFGNIRAGDGQLDAVLARTAVFAFPSEIDKSSYAVLEAMAASVPVVTADVGALPELVEDGVTGRVFEAGNDAALGDALASLLDDPDRRRTMADAARQKVETTFDARITTAALVDVLREAQVRFARQATVPASP